MGSPVIPDTITSDPFKNLRNQGISLPSLNEFVGREDLPSILRKVIPSAIVRPDVIPEIAADPDTIATVDTLFQELSLFPEDPVPVYKPSPVSDNIVTETGLVLPNPYHFVHRPPEIKAIGGPISRTLSAVGKWRLGSQIEGGLDLAKHAFLNPIETIKSMLTAPFIITARGLQELRTPVTIGERPPSIEEVMEERNLTYGQAKRFIESKYGTMTPYEAKEARRALSMFWLSTIAGGGFLTAGRSLAASLGLKGISAANVAGVTAATGTSAAFGFLEADPENRISLAVGYGIIALPFGLSFGAFSPLMKKASGISSTDKVSEAATAAAHMKMTRVLDQIPESESLKGLIDKETLEGLVVPTRLKEAVDASSRLANEGQFREAEGVLRKAIEEGEGKMDFTEERLNVAEKGAVVSKIDSPLSLAIVDPELNTVAAILKIHSSIRPDGVSIIPGIKDPTKALSTANKLLPGPFVSAIYKRPDGLFDLAIGGIKSPLKGSQSQFAQQGFFNGQAVIVDGKIYKYDGKQGNLVRIVEPGSKKERRIVLVEPERLRRGPYVDEVPAPDKTVEDVLKDLKEVLVDEPSTYDAIVKMYSKLNPPIESGKVLPKPSIEVIAASNNMKVERGSPGTWKVIDGETGRVLVRGLRSVEDAERFINESLQSIGSDTVKPPPDIPLDTLGNMLGPPGGDDISGPSGSYGVPFTAAPKWRLVDSFRIAIDERFRWITSRRSLFEAMDGRFPGLQLVSDLWLPTQQALNRLRSKLNPLMSDFKNRLEPLLIDLSKERRELILDAKETMSAQELLDLATPDEVSFIDRLVKLDVDLSRIYRFRRELKEAIESARLIARAEQRELQPNELEIIRDTLIERSKMTSAELSAVDLFDEIVSHDMMDASLYKITRAHDAISDKSMSRNEFMDFHKFTAKERRAVELLDEFYSRVAKIINIPDERLIPGYVSHARKYGFADANTAFEQRSPTRSYFDIAQRMTAEMIRSGEISDYIRDPVANFVHYANSSISFVEFVDLWNTLANTFKHRIGALETDFRGNRVSLSDKDRIRQNVDDYLNDLRGFNTEAQKALLSYVEEFADALNVKMPKTKKLDITNMFLAVNSSAALGWRPGMGFRDLVDYIVRTGARYGYKSAFDYISKVNPLTEEGRSIVADLESAGRFNQLHHLEFAVPGELQTMVAQRVVSRVAEAGLRASLQPQLHRLIQAAVFLLQRDLVAKHVNKLVLSGENTLPLAEGNAKWKAYERAKVFTFTDGPISRFDELITAGKTVEAADFISELAAREVAYDYGSGNGPYGSRRPFHRLALQFGTWSINTRSYLLKGISRGTRKDRYGFAARFLLGQSALYATQLATGLNMSRFYLVPGIFFSGGPFLQYLSFAAGMASGSEWEQERSAWAFSRLFPNFREGDVRSLLLPGSYAMYDMGAALKMLYDGENIIHATGRSVSIPVQERRHNWWDMYQPISGVAEAVAEGLRKTIPF